MKLTAIYEPCAEGGFTCWVEEMSEVISQGDTMEEARHLTACGCSPVREGGNHSIWKNSANGKVTSIPRHREIKDPTAWSIYR